jgi:Na+/melibiose symporter-like transporter
MEPDLKPRNSKQEIEQLEKEVAELQSAYWTAIAPGGRRAIITCLTPFIFLIGWLGFNRLPSSIRHDYSIIPSILCILYFIFMIWLVYSSQTRRDKNNEENKHAQELFNRLNEKRARLKDLKKAG